MRKKRVKIEKFQRRPVGIATAAGQAMVPAPANAPNGNQNYLMDLEAAINTILKCPTFRNIQDADPIRITQVDTSKSHCVFNSDGCAVALGREKRYIAAGNFWWQNLLGSPTPGVPLRKARVMDLACHMFNLNLERQAGQPLEYLPHLKSMIVVLVDSATQVAQHNLPRVSPEEIVHAVVFGCAREVSAGGSAGAVADYLSVLLLHL